MNSKTLLRLVVAAAALLVQASPCFANWTLNLGYQNPRPATYGINFLYLGSKWGFEAGIGWIDVNAEQAKDDDDEDKDGNAAGSKDDKDDGDASFAVAGDLDLKYFFASGGVRPYVEVGVGAGFGGDDDSGLHAGAGGLFGGIGVLAGSPSLYVYVGATADSAADPRLEAGLGFDI